MKLRRSLFSCSDSLVGRFNNLVQPTHTIVDDESLSRSAQCAGRCTHCMVFTASIITVSQLPVLIIKYRFACRPCVRQLEQMEAHKRKADEIGMKLKQLLLQAVHREDIVLGKRGRASTCTTPGSTSKPPVKRNPALLTSPRGSLPHVRRSLFNDQSAAEVSNACDCMVRYCM